MVITNTCITIMYKLNSYIIVKVSGKIIYDPGQLGARYETAQFGYSMLAYLVN